jgi:hypothetical protein
VRSDGNGAVFTPSSTTAFWTTQWLARQLHNQPSMSNSIKADIASKGNPIRTRLGGTVLQQLVALLEQTRSTGAHINAALFELNDIELVPRRRRMSRSLRRSRVPTRQRLIIGG